jgi:hypothetical protein
VPAHGLAPQNLSSDKHVDVCAESDEDRGSTPLASSLRSQQSGERRLPRRSLGEGGSFSFTTRMLRPTTRQASTMSRFAYVYILQSQTDPKRFHVGRTHDLRQRMLRHNSGNGPAHTNVIYAGAIDDPRLRSPPARRRTRFSSNRGTVVTAILSSKSNFQLRSPNRSIPA